MHKYHEQIQEIKDRDSDPEKVGGGLVLQDLKSDGQEDSFSIER